MLNEKEKLIIVGGAVLITGGLLFYFSKNLLEFLGIAPDAEAKKEAEITEKKNTELLEGQKEKVDTLLKEGQKPSYLKATYLEAANVIHDATKKAGIDDSDKIAVDTLLRYTPKEIDFAKISEAYGRREHFGLLGIKMGARTLMQCLTQELSSSEKNRVNKEFARRKLKTRIL
jgi:hypothetical protein